MALAGTDGRFVVGRLCAQVGMVAGGRSVGRARAIASVDFVGVAAGGRLGAGRRSVAIRGFVGRCGRPGGVPERGFAVEGLVLVALRLLRRRMVGGDKPAFIIDSHSFFPCYPRLVLEAARRRGGVTLHH